MYGFTMYTSTSFCKVDGLFYMMIHTLYDDILYDEILIIPRCGLLVYISLNNYLKLFVDNFTK